MTLTHQRPRSLGWIFHKIKKFNLPVDRVRNARMAAIGYKCADHIISTRKPLSSPHTWSKDLHNTFHNSQGV